LPRVARLSQVFAPRDREFFDLFEEAGGNIARAADLLDQMLSSWPDRKELARDILICEQDGDRITHDIIHRLNGGGTGKPPLDPADGHTLATTLDDIVDYAEQAADELSLYAVEAPMEQATLIADVLVGAGEQVAQALRCLRSGAELAPHLVEIHRLENEGDRLSRDAVASLFANGIDPMVVIRWKDIFETLEQSVDACEKVAHVLEGISLKRKSRKR
jgi:predicted phosphate transport protein (TIGR00153 family)